MPCTRSVVWCVFSLNFLWTVVLSEGALSAGTRVSLGLSARAGVKPPITWPVCLGCQQLETSGCVHLGVITCKYPEQRDTGARRVSVSLTGRQQEFSTSRTRVCSGKLLRTLGLGNFLGLICTWVFAFKSETTEKNKDPGKPWQGNHCACCTHTLYIYTLTFSANKPLF